MHTVRSALTRLYPDTGTSLSSLHSAVERLVAIVEIKLSSSDGEHLSCGSLSFENIPA